MQGPGGAEARRLHVPDGLDDREYTRLGFLSVANVRGATGDYNDAVTADNTLSLGFSQSGKKGTFTLNGSASATNSISADGGITRGRGYHQMVKGHLYYADNDISGTLCRNGFHIGVSSSVGDVTDMKQWAPKARWNPCSKDPHGWAVVGPDGHWGYDYSQADSYAASASWFGFSFGSANGFTHTVQEVWHARRTATAVCGNKTPVQDSGRFWNLPH